MADETSKNTEAGRLLGLRDTGFIALSFPVELHYHCPVCVYENLTNGTYDTRLHWSEYNGFIWCQVCNVDYPSCLCIPDNPARATDIFLRTVADALSRAQPKENFFDAVRADPEMTPEQKAEWLALEPEKGDKP